MLRPLQISENAFSAITLHCSTMQLSYEILIQPLLELNYLLADRNRRSSSPWPQREGDDARADSKSASLHQLPCVCSRMPSKSTGHLRFTNEIIWPSGTQGSAHGGFCPKTQLASGVGKDFPFLGDPPWAAKASLCQSPLPGETPVPAGLGQTWCEPAETCPGHLWPHQRQTDRTAQSLTHPAQRWLSYRWSQWVLKSCFESMFLPGRIFILPQKLMCRKRGLSSTPYGPIEAFMIWTSFALHL